MARFYTRSGGCGFMLPLIFSTVFLTGVSVRICFLLNRKVNSDYGLFLFAAILMIVMNIFLIKFFLEYESMPIYYESRGTRDTIGRVKKSILITRFYPISEEPLVPPTEDVKKVAEP